MDVQKRKYFSKKRKFEGSSDFIKSKHRNRPFTAEDEAEERALTRELFGDHEGFIKSLEEIELECGTSSSGYEVDSGIGEPESESNDENKKRPVWVDEDDDGIDVGTALKAQGRNLPDGGFNSKTAQYSNLLQNKFKNLVGTPKWASLDRQHTKDDSDDEILQTCGHIVKNKSHALQSNSLEYKRVKDLNIETYNEGPIITTVQFHHKFTVALVCGLSGIASLLTVDGKRNNKLHSVAFHRFPIKCARFINDGSEALLGSQLSHFFSYDLETAKAIEVPLPKGVTNAKKFETSSRNILAVAGKWGQVHLMCTQSKELITTLKQNTNVTALAFNPEGSQLFGHSDTGEVTIWDLSTRRVQHKFYDNGCLQGTTLTFSPSGQYLATGSAQGVVNLYDIQSSIFQSQNPNPKKSIMNLTTSINSLSFNSTSEILGFCSSELSNSVRLFHVPSKTVFSNFPLFSTKLGGVNTVSFSPNSGYAAFGNVKSTVSLFRLKHYNNY